MDKILSEMKTARFWLAELSRWGHGRLRLGASTTACQYILPTVLREFKQSFPKCVISIDPGDHARQMDLLLHNHIDLAIMLEPEGMKEVTFVPLFTDEMRFLLAPAHQWVRAGRVQRETLENETVILYNQTIGALVSLPLGKRKLRRRWDVAHLRSRRLSLGEETFVGLCQSVTAEFAGPDSAAA